MSYCFMSIEKIKTGGALMAKYHHNYRLVEVENGISYDCFVFVHLTFLLVLKNIYSFNMKGYENKNSQEVNCHFCFSYKNEFFLSEYIVKKENFYI